MDQQIADFRARLIQARRRKLMRQEDLAKAAGLKRRLVEITENEPSTTIMPRRDVIAKLAAALDIDPAWLEAGDDADRVRYAYLPIPASMDERDRLILQAARAGVSYADIGRDIGLTRERVRRLFDRADLRLRHYYEQVVTA